MGLYDESFEGIVVQILNHHVPDLGEGAIVAKLSKEGRYISITANIRAKSQAQLDALYMELSAHPQILMVL